MSHNKRVMAIDHIPAPRPWELSEANISNTDELVDVLKAVRIQLAQYLDGQVEDLGRPRLITRQFEDAFDRIWSAQPSADQIKNAQSVLGTDDMGILDEQMDRVYVAVLSLLHENRRDPSYDDTVLARDVLFETAGNLKTKDFDPFSDLAPAV